MSLDQTTHSIGQLQMMMSHWFEAQALVRHQTQQKNLTYKVDPNYNQFGSSHKKLDVWPWPSLASSKINV